MRGKANSCGEIVLEDGVDIVDGGNDDMAASETDVVVSEPLRKISILPIFHSILNFAYHKNVRMAKVGVP